MTHKLICSSSLLVVVIAVAACPKTEPAQGEFGDAKKPDDKSGMVQKPPADSAPAPDFNSAASVEGSFDKASNKLTVTLKLKPGFHAYAPGESIGKPVELAVDESGGWKMDGTPTIPAGQTHQLDDSLGGGTSVTLEGDVPLTALVKGGSGNISGKVTAQVCSEKACDRPRVHPFAVPTT